MRAWIRGVPRRELTLLAAAVALGIAIRVIALVALRHHALAGDQPQYDADAKLWALGHHFWSTTPSGIPHPSMWKAPGYTAWLGVLYDVLGTKPHRVELVQVLFISPITIVLVWALARRLFGAGVATIAAFVAAVYPFLWQFDVLLYPEPLSVALAAAVCLLVLGRTPTLGRAAGAGALLGLSMLVRPTAVMFGAMILVSWITAVGLRAGAKFTVVSALCAVLVITPWTLRNHHVFGGWVPISVQDAAAYGTFSDEAAADPEYPWAWRSQTAKARPIFLHQPPYGDRELRSKLQRLARDYISDHPSSVPRAWFYNGITRTFDLRRPSHITNEVAFEGRSKALTILGIVMYWPMALLALFTLWMLRRRRDIVLPLLALFVAATVVFTSDGSTRYRATLEPLIIVLACAAPGLRRGRPTT